MEITQQLKQNKIEDLLNMSLSPDTISKALNINKETLVLAGVDQYFIKPVELLRETAELYRYQFLQTCSLWNSYCEQISTDYEQYDMKTFQELLEDLKKPLGSVQQFNDIKHDLCVDIEQNKQKIQEIKLKEEKSRILLKNISDNISSITKDLNTFKRQVNQEIMNFDEEYQKLNKAEQEALEELATKKGQIQKEHDNINNHLKQIEVLIKNVSDLSSSIIDFEKQIKDCEDDIKLQENLQEIDNQEQIYLKDQINEVKSQNKKLDKNVSNVRNNKNGIELKILQMKTSKQQLEQKIKDYDSKYNSMNFFQKKWQDTKNIIFQQRQQWQQDLDTLEIDLPKEELSLKHIQEQETQNQKQVNNKKSYLDDKNDKRGQNVQNQKSIYEKIKEISTQKNDQDNKMKKLEYELIEEKNKLESSIQSKNKFGNDLIQLEIGLQNINDKIQKLIETKAQTKQKYQDLLKLQIPDQFLNSIQFVEFYFRGIRDEQQKATIMLLEHESTMQQHDKVQEKDLQKLNFDNKQKGLRKYIEQTSKTFQTTFKNIAQKSQEILQIIKNTKKNMYIQQDNQKQVLQLE